MNRLFAVLTRMFVRLSMNTGIKHFALKRKSEAAMSPVELMQARSAKAMTNKPKKAARLGRRFLR